MTDQDVLEFQADLLRQVSDIEATGVVMDISSLDTVDSFMARVLNDSARMVRLLGATVVMCGMKLAVALTLIEMGRELIGVEKALNLEQGMLKVQQNVGNGGADDEGQSEPLGGQDLVQPNLLHN